ncbi:hypothetical protein [Estrella lausannensis]|uniref:Putative membrane protein n=1 Tax=Estrella lausannensis TaxID=483423 RepID=A0A0H5DNQ8_9BACT|nr:hypothetical protein [Estrella lausannensis]CRX37912.1 putative membrane protein [Estrella lausannensis]
MSDRIQQLNLLTSGDTLFLVAAFIGTGLFFIQLLFNAFGGGHSDDSNGEFDTLQFKWLSKQAVTGFLMMFGWMGLTATHEFEFSLPSALGIALSGGALLLIITGSLFKGASKLHSPGSQFRIEDTLGKKGLLYQRIKDGNSGKVTVILNQMTYEIDALSETGEDIPSFTPVKITKINDDKTVVVAKT